jgi:integrase
MVTLSYIVEIRCNNNIIMGSRRSKDDALIESELEILLNSCNPNDPRERLIILVAGNLGLREGEISAMRSSWINFQRGHIIIPSESGQGWTPKRPDSSRTIPALSMSQRAWEAARNYFTAHPSLDITRMTVYRIVVKVAELSGLKKAVYPHSLRATAATRLAYKVHNHIILCDIFGWKQLSVGKYYIKRSGGRAEIEIERALS